MYEFHDSTERYPAMVLFDFEQELPEPLDYWTLHDFTDIVPVIANHAS